MSVHKRKKMLSFKFPILKGSTHDSMKFKTLVEAQNYLYSFRSRWDEQIAPSFKFERVQEFAKLLGDPQNKIKVIHIAGTSGKGSTTGIISKLLAAHGKKTGSSISPHVYDFRERYQVNNELLDQEKCLKYIHEFIPVIEKMNSLQYGQVTFFEISILLAYYIFFKERVDYAVMETGAGGRFDATNVAYSPNKIAVITKIGLDHTTLLGKTIGAIAGQKADIIHKNNIAISVKQRPSAQKVIDAKAIAMNSKYSLISPDTNFKAIQIVDGSIQFNYQYKELSLKNLKLSLNGLFQVENASIALAAVYEASQRDGFILQEDIIRETFSSMSNPGRFDERVIDGKRIIIDGAHNPQKMSAFIKSLKMKYPGEMFDFLIAFKHGKDFSGMLKYIIPLARDIYATEFELSEQAEIMYADSAEKISGVLKRKFGFMNVQEFPNSTDAFSRACENQKRTLVVTGSLYLIGELYREMRKK